MSEGRKDDVGQHAGRAISGNQNASIYSENIVLNGSRGHGFAAEKANHLYDKYSGRDAELVGADNLKDGADRLVDGVSIQTKYCSSGSKCVSEAFRDGRYRYMKSDGTPMQLEVPLDKYDSALQAMQERIKKGEVPGVTDPLDAEKIVRKGHFTYEQAKNIAKAGTVEGIIYDAVKGVEVAATAACLTVILTYATEKWRGQSSSKALESACFQGICVGGLAWMSSILVAQVGRTGLDQSLRGGSEWLVKKMSPQVVSALANAFRGGNNIYGAAAARHVDKLLRGSVTTTLVVSTILSVDDFISLFSREISGTQAFKNICKTTSSVAGGASGAWAGAALGAKVGSLGGPIGAVAGGALAGAVASLTSGKVLDSIVDDDSVGIERIMNETFASLAEDYYLSEDEARVVISDFKNLDMPNLIKRAYSSSDRRGYVRQVMEPFFERTVERRPPVFLPSKKRLAKSVSEVIENFESQVLQG